MTRQKKVRHRLSEKQKKKRLAKIERRKVDRERGKYWKR